MYEYKKNLSVEGWMFDVSSLITWKAKGQVLYSSNKCKTKKYNTFEDQGNLQDK